MKIIKKIMCLCMALLMVWPVTAYAQEDDNVEEPVVSSYSERLQIEYLSQEEAERLYYKWKENEGISVYSDLQTCDIALTSSNGELVVLYSTACRGIASKIGVRNLTLQQKSGLLWEDIVIKNEYSENTGTFLGGFKILNPVVGRRYRAHCTHYAIKNDVELSAYAETDIFIFE